MFEHDRTDGRVAARKRGQPCGHDCRGFGRIEDAAGAASVKTEKVACELGLEMTGNVVFHGRADAGRNSVHWFAGGEASFEDGAPGFEPGDKRGLVADDRLGEA